MSYEILQLDPDEHVILEVRKHWIVFLEHIIGLLISASFPIILFTVIKMFLPSLLNISLPGNAYALFLFFYCLWLLTLWILFFLHWTKYYLDVWYVTEKRIIAIDQKGTFYREISNLRFDKIQDVTINVRGFIATFLGFGDVRVQTASDSVKDFFMRFARRPDEVRRVIFGQHNKTIDNIKINTL